MQLQKLFLSLNTLLKHTKMTTLQLPKHYELFSKFHKGFYNFSSMTVHEEMIVFKVGGQLHNACDMARKRINEFQLPLTAKITSHNTFVVEPTI